MTLPMHRSNSMATPPGDIDEDAAGHFEKGNASRKASDKEFGQSSPRQTAA
jgi:hypothetical protein